MRQIKVAVVQQTPIFWDNTKTIELVADETMAAARLGATLVLFPESFLPGYPRGLTFGAAVGSRSLEGRELWQQYWDHSIAVGNSEFVQLSKIAQKAGVILAVGVTEKDPVNSSLYCSLFIFDQHGSLIHKHRKIKPTGTERVIWAEGNGRSLTSVKSSAARIGGLICWENMMPEARMALYRSGIDVYLAPTADARDSWTSSMQHIACESRSFVLSANQYFAAKHYPEHIEKYLVDDLPDPLCRGGSLIVSPYGVIIAGPLFNQTGILMAEIDLDEITRSRMDFDPIGHYSRPDLFTTDMQEDES